ncbi:MAG TPA: hypothetical protein V6D11_08375 [Waterburya sp.]
MFRLIIAQTNMDWRSLMLVVSMSGLALALPASVVNVRVSTASASPEQPPLQLSVEQLRQLAQKITVKVWSADFLGSGIVIQRQGAIYTVSHLATTY